MRWAQPRDALPPLPAPGEVSGDVANYTFEDRVTRQRVYKLQMPSNAVEMEKMLQAAYRDNAQQGARDGDDAVRVESDEETVYLVFDLPEFPDIDVTMIETKKQTKKKGH